MQLLVPAWFIDQLLLLSLVTKKVAPKSLQAGVSNLLFRSLRGV